MHIRKGAYVYMKGRLGARTLPGAKASRVCDSLVFRRNAYFGVRFAHMIAYELQLVKEHRTILPEIHICTDVQIWKDWAKKAASSTRCGDARNRPVRLHISKYI